MDRKLVLALPLLSQILFTLTNPMLYSLPPNIPVLSGFMVLFLIYPTAPLIVFYPLFTKLGYRGTYALLSTIFVTVFFVFKSYTQYNVWRHNSKELTVALITNAALYLCWWAVWMISPQLYP